LSGHFRTPEKEKKKEGQGRARKKENGEERLTDESTGNRELFGGPNAEKSKKLRDL
jgi:hypothetical protein